MASLPDGVSRAGAERLAEFEAMYCAGRRPFDYDHRAVEALRHERVAALASRLADPATPVVDLGCGLGHITRLLRRPGRALLGMDLSPTAVARARAALRQDVQGGHAREAATTPPLIAGSSLELPFRDGSLGLVVASDGLVSWHLSRAQRAAALGEIVRVLKPRGWVLLTEYLRPGQWADFTAEVRASGVEVTGASGFHDRPCYWMESWIRSIRGWPIGRLMRRSRRLAIALLAAGRLLGDRGCRHLVVTGRKAA